MQPTTRRRGATVAQKSKSPKRRIRSRNDTSSQSRSTSVSENKQLKVWGNVIREYLSEKDLEYIIAEVVMELLSKPELPENPYVYLSNRVRQMEHQLALKVDFVELSHGNEELAENLGQTGDTGRIEVNELEPGDPSSGVTCTVESNRLWGWAQVLKVIHVQELASLWQKLSASNYMIYNEDKEDHGYRIRVISSLCGPIVLFGGVLPFYPTTAHINHDFLIEGPNFEKAVKRFAQAIMKDIFTLGQSDIAVVSCVYIETPVRGQGKIKSAKKKQVELQQWSVEKIQSSKSSFISAVKIAVVSKRRVFADVLARVSSTEIAPQQSKPNAGGGNAERGRNRRFSIDSTVSYDSYDSVLLLDGEYVQFAKHFLFHFRLREDVALEQQDENSKSSGKKQNQIRFFGEHVACSLAYGVFGSKQDAIDYANMFKTASGSHLKPQSEQLRSYKDLLKLCMMQAYELGELFQTSVELCGLCMWSNNYRILADLKKLFASQAGALRSLIHINRAIQRVVTIVQGSSRSKDYQSVHLDAVQYQFLVFTEEIGRVFNIRDSCEVAVIQKLVESTLNSIRDPFSRMRTSPDAIQLLVFLEHICLATEMTVARDIVSLLCKSEETEDNNDTPSIVERESLRNTRKRNETIMELAKQVVRDVMQKRFEEMSAENPTKTSKSSNGNSDGFWSSVGISFSGNQQSNGKPDSTNGNMKGNTARKVGTIKDAMEQRALRTKLAEESMSVLNVRDETKRGIKKMRFPAQLAPEATILQYVSDTRLDNVVHDVLFNVLTRRTLSPNPIPIVTTQFRSECARLPLWTEDDSELSRRFGPKARLKVAHQPSFVYGITTGNTRNFELDKADPLATRGVFGSRSAVQLAYSAPLLVLLGFLETSIRNSSPPPPGHATYSALVNIGLGGDALLFSQIDRHGTPQRAVDSLSNFSVFESYIVEGPRISGAVALFAHMVVEHAIHVFDKTPHLMLGLKTGKEALAILNTDNISGHDGGWKEQKPHHSSSITEKHDDDPVDGDERVKESVPILHVKGKSFDGITLKREKPACIREVVRATNAKEPVVAIFSVTFPSPQDAAGLSRGNETPHSSRYVLLVKQFGMFFKEVPSGRVTSTLPNYCSFDHLYRLVWPTLGQAIQGVSAINSASDVNRGMRNTIDPDDPNSPLYQQYQQRLKLRISRSASRGDWFAVYKSLMWLQVLQNRMAFVTGDSSNSFTKTLEAEVADVVRGLKSKSIPRQLYEGEIAAVSLARILKARCDSEDFRGKVNKKMLKEMVQRCCETIESTVARPDCVYFSGLGITVHTLLITISSLVEKDRSGRETEHIRLLHELCAYLECMKVSASASVHHNSIPVQKQIQAMSR